MNNFTLLPVSRYYNTPSSPLSNVKLSENLYMFSNNYFGRVISSVLYFSVISFLPPIQK